MSKPLIDREYLPYWKWEEVKFNMWGTTDNKFEMLEWAIEFTGDAEKYGSWMLKVVDDWPGSCAHNLSNATQNRKAWIGHAACAYANKCPEDVTRKAWSFLTKEQQIKANAKAQAAIELWEFRQCQN